MIAQKYTMFLENSVMNYKSNFLREESIVFLLLTVVIN